MWVIAKYIKYIVIFAVLWIVLGLYSNISCHKIYYNHMEPTLKQEDFKPVSAGVRSTDEIKDGDIVIYQYLASGQQLSTYYCGRVVAKEGDVVAMKAGKVVLNGQEQNESYVPADSFIGTENMEPMIIPRGHFFILGDNRKSRHLADSRSFGPIPQEALVGKVRDSLW